MPASRPAFHTCGTQLVIALYFDATRTGPRILDVVPESEILAMRQVICPRCRVAIPEWSVAR
jgi:hypothetical protein